MNMQDSYTFVVYVGVTNFSFSLKTKCLTHSLICYAGYLANYRALTNCQM